MRIVPISDLHVEHQLPGTIGDMIAEIPKDTDVLVVAGDVGHNRRLSGFFDVMCDNFSNIIYVIGNHEYYHASIEDVEESVQKIDNKHSNFYFLDNDTCTIGGVRFVGSTLWFPFQESNIKFERPMSDFGQIPEFRNWVYQKNEAAQEFLNETVLTTDVVVTHYLPSYTSVSPEFIGSPYNRFFVCPMEDLIERQRPRVWIHGHTHTACWYKIKDTRIVCNPFGYEDVGEKTGFCPWLTLEIEN